MVLGSSVCAFVSWLVRQKLCHLFLGYGVRLGSEPAKEMLLVSIKGIAICSWAEKFRPVVSKQNLEVSLS